MGIEGSPSIIFLRGNDFINENHKPKIGLMGGFFFQVNLSELVSLRTNIAYERKGSVVTDLSGSPLGYSIHANFEYLTLPILVRATFDKKIQYFVNAGPYFGYLIKQNTVSKGGSTPTTIIDNTSLDKRFDTGISTGLGLSVPIKSKFAVSFEARNNLGLMNVSAVPVANDGAVKTNSTNFLFGFTYKFGSGIE